MEKTNYKVRVDNTVSTPFIVEKKLKQGNALYLIIFNLALEKVVRKMHCIKEGHST